MARRIVRTKGDLADAIRELRRERGMTQEELAEWIGVHRNYIGQLERGDMSAQLERTLEVLSLLGVDVVLVPRSGPMIDVTDPLTADRQGTAEMDWRVGVLRAPSGSHHRSR